MINGLRLLASNLSHSESISLNPERPAYIPPHLRNRPQAATPPAHPEFLPPAHSSFPELNGNGVNSSNGYHAQTGLPTPAPTPIPARGAYIPPTARLGGAATAAEDGGWGAPRKPSSDARSYGGGPASAPPGYGIWKNGHVVGQRNARMEKELFGEAGDGVHAVRSNGLSDFPLIEA